METYQCDYYSQVNHEGYHKLIKRQKHRKIFQVQEQTKMFRPFFSVPLVTGKGERVHRRAESTQVFKRIRNYICNYKSHGMCLIRVEPHRCSSLFIRYNPGSKRSVALVCCSTAFQRQTQRSQRQCHGKGWAEPVLPWSALAGPHLDVSLLRSLPLLKFRSFMEKYLSYADTIIKWYD